MAVEVVVFDVGETLVDETRTWEHAADEGGVPRFTLMALMGVSIGAGESHRRAFEVLGLRPSRQAFRHDQWYADAVPCLARLRAAGLRVGAAGNMAVEHEELIRPHVDFVGSSERWGAEKPSTEFFARVVAEAGVPRDRIAYVGDRADNDMEPALAAGMTAVHIRRGPWGYAHEPPAGAVRIDSLDELPAALP